MSSPDREVEIQLPRSDYTIDELWDNGIVPLLLAFGFQPETIKELVPDE